MTALALPRHLAGRLPADLRLAGPDDVAAVGALVAEGFHPQPVDCWLVPDPAVRRRVMPAWFGAASGTALARGTVHLGRDVVAVWTPVDGPDAGSDGPDADEVDETAEAGPDPQTALFAERFAAIGEAFEQAHAGLPPHDHLDFLVVREGLRGQGIGAALMALHHDRLDALGRPAGLDAATAESRRFYLRHGYRDLGEPFPVGPGGPVMWPMWRPPGGEGPLPR